MAKAILACYKNPQLIDFEKFGRAAAARLAPDNVVASDPYISFDEKVKTLIYNPTPTIRTKGRSICLGMAEKLDDLFVPSSSLPEGSYALFRVGEDKIEIASDYASSRTIWYYSDKDVFLASTSQRLIVSFLGNLEFNEKACGWFLSSGTLGPGLSWDTRIKMLPPRTSLFLDRKAWAISFERDDNYEFRVESDGFDKSYFERNLEQAVQSSISNLNIQASQWTLALSGGMDSRGLLYYLPHENLNSVTWGLRSSMKFPRSDASIAKRLADVTGIGHYYAETDYKKQSFPTVLDRFLSAGEGRIDHFGGYLDGLEIWGDLSGSGRGVVRGYDAFGRKPPVTTEYQVRRTCNLATSQYAPDQLPDKFFISESEIPEHLNKKDGESLEDWRDRLWLQYRTPITTAALEDIKLAYVEIINPLLCKDVVRSVQDLPKGLRTNKKVWDSIISKMYPSVPYACMDATQEVGEVLSQPDVKEYICDGLLGSEQIDFLTKPFADFLVDNYDSNRNKDALRQKLRTLIIAYMPRKVENLIRARIGPSPLSNQWLAIRCFMVSKIREMYTKDSKIAKEYTHRSKSYSDALS